MKHPLCIGLTGGIGSGKTTVTAIFSEFGVPVIDADEISHDVVQVGRPALEEIAGVFGPEFIGEDGGLRRDRLRQRVFDDDTARRTLESIIHPRVRREIDRRIQQVTRPYCIISIPLLLESRGNHHLDRILVVDAPEVLQVHRASLRDGANADDIRKIVNSQMDRQERVRAADDIIINDGDLEDLRSQVESLHEKYLGIAAAQKAG